MIVESVAKHGDKSSAFELSINYIYKLSFPRERVDLRTFWASSSTARTTPVKTPTPTQPTARVAKAAKINFDFFWKAYLSIKQPIRRIDLDLRRGALRACSYVYAKVLVGSWWGWTAAVQLRCQLKHSGI